MKYLLIALPSSFELSSTINKYLEQGWKLYGSPCIAKLTDNNYSCIYSQAVIYESK